MGMRKRRADHRAQDAEALKAQALARKEKREQKKILERLGTKFCACGNPAIGDPAGLSLFLLTMCDACARKNRINETNQKFGIVPAVKTNLGSKLAAALKKS